MSEMGYKGMPNLDVSYFYCPYIPGQKYVEPEWDHRALATTPTEIQRRIMSAVRFTPTLTNAS